MMLVVGLGNPGRRYERTRHNVGFRLAERLRERWRMAPPEERFDARFARARVASLGGLDVGVLEPQTFMNESGASLAAALRKLPVADPAREVLIALDDADLPFGRLRLRAAGGDGGHRGLADLIERLGRRDLPRLRFGIGRPSLPMDTSDFVLARFTKEEETALTGHLDRAAEAVETFLTRGIAEAMNRFNAETGEDRPSGA
jgi:PTH1 family peptidyl-tRNA hydrolase